MEKEIKVFVPEGKSAQWVNGVLTLVDEVDNRPITERIKTLADAMEALGQGNTLVEEYIAVRDKLHTDAGELLAYLKLRIITAALNEGWEPQFTEDEFRYYPWFEFFTQSELDNMSDEDKGRVVGRASNSSVAYGGLACVGAVSASSKSGGYYGSRFAFKTRELAEYAGKQFTKEYGDFIFNLNGKEVNNG